MQLLMLNNFKKEKKMKRMENYLYSQDNYIY